MNKKQLFEKYNIDESHNEWDHSIDNWYSVEIYRAMHDGKLPTANDQSTKWIVDFLDKAHENHMWLRSLAINGLNWGSFYLTAKRMVYSLADEILKEINNENV